MNSHQRSRFSGILKETEDGGDQETAGGDPGIQQLLVPFAWQSEQQ
jgi:hypothetical protein